MIFKRKKKPSHGFKRVTLIQRSKNKIQRERNPLVKNNCR